jgi:hypothetical protein
MKLKSNLPLETIVSPFGANLKTTTSGLGALKDLPSPLSNAKTATTCLTLGLSTTPRLNRLQPSSSLTLSSTPRSFMGEILQVIVVLFDVVRQNDYL